jgi:hypothetical protein
MFWVLYPYSSEIRDVGKTVIKLLRHDVGYVYRTNIDNELRSRKSCVNWRFASIFRVEKFVSEEPACSGSSLADFSTLKMETIRSSETSVHTRSTRRHIPEDGILHSHRCENLKCYELRTVRIKAMKSSWPVLLITWIITSFKEISQLSTSFR